MRRTIAPAIVGVVVAALGGCGHYIVTEPGSGKTYHTRYINRNLSSRAITFRDDETGKKVTLDSWEFQKVPREVYYEDLDADQRAAR